MADRNKRFLLDLRLRDGNSTCVDCDCPDPEWASYNLGVFLCEACASVHRSLGCHISKVRSIRLDNWEDDQVKYMEAEGNRRARSKFEMHVPTCYLKPTSQSPQVLRDQWIRAKYERHEFMDPEKQLYLASRREGYLWKRGKDDKKFNRRRFILDANENSLAYYNKEEAKEPKAKLRLDEINATLVPEKVGNPNALQILFPQDGHTRNLFLYSEDAKDIIDWFVSIRAAKFARAAIAFPGVSEPELARHLTHDFIKEGWLSKTGPRQGDAYRRRWFTLDRRTLMYYEDPLDAFPKGEIFVGTKDREFTVREGVPPGTKDPGCSFTLRTPDRRFHFAADDEQDRVQWMAVLTSVIDTPLSPQDTSNFYRKSHSKRR